MFQEFADAIFRAFVMLVISVIMAGGFIALLDIIVSEYRR